MSWKFSAPRSMPLLVRLAFRITRGIDLSDESDYAVFLDDWLKEGIRESPFLTLHQTAALVVYPAVLLFRWVMGATDGLILFLRSLDIVGAMMAAISAAVLFRRSGTCFGAWLAGALVLAFIPFGLPAPSYNTIGEQVTIAHWRALGARYCDSKSRGGPCRGLYFRHWLGLRTRYPSLLFALGLFAFFSVLAVHLEPCCWSMAVYLWDFRWLPGCP